MTTVIDSARNDAERQTIEEFLSLLAERQTLEDDWRNSVETQADDFTAEQGERLRWIEARTDELAPLYAAITDPNRAR